MSNPRARRLEKLGCKIGGWSVVGLSLFAGSPAYALTPEQIFAKDSPSIVVVVAYDASGHPADLGSGVVVAQGQVVTNCHVVKNKTTLKVKQDKVTYPATLHLADFDRDLCQLFVPQLLAPAVQMGDSATLKTGANVVAIGAPEGLELTISSGLISSLRDFGDGTKIIQTSAAISPGSSGGGLFDERGLLVGITFAQSKEGQNLNFALPVSWLERLSQHNASTSISPPAISTIDWVTAAIKLEDKHDWSDLEQLVRRWVKAQPQNDIAWYALGEALQNMHRYSDAEDAYVQSLRLNSNNGIAWHSLGTASGQAKQWHAAVVALSQAVKFDATNETIWRELSCCRSRRHHLKLLASAARTGLD